MVTILLAACAVAVARSGGLAQSTNARFVLPPGGMEARSVVLDGQYISGNAHGSGFVLEVTTGKLSVMTDCFAAGVTGSIAVEADCKRAHGAESFTAVQLPRQDHLWHRYETGSIDAVADGFAVVDLWNQDSVGRTILHGLAASSGATVWKTSTRCPVDSLGLGSVAGSLAVFATNPGCGTSALHGRVVVWLPTGRIVDTDDDMFPQRFVLVGSQLVTWSGGGRWGQYEPARIKIYNLSDGTVAINYNATPDAASLAGADPGGVEASDVTVTPTALYVQVRGRVFRYAKPVGSSDPKPFAVPDARWLGVADGESLLFAQHNTLVVVNGTESDSTPETINGANGPFTSAVAVGEMAFVLTSDRRILTVDLVKRDTTSTTLAPECVSLVAVHVFNNQSTAICTLDPRGDKVVAIGLADALK